MTYQIKPETRYIHTDGKAYYQFRAPSTWRTSKWVLESETTEDNNGNPVVDLSKAAMWTLYWQGGIEGPL